MRIQDLGHLTGDVLLFGGPYSNLQAFDALQSRHTDIPSSNRICTGDVVAYCADANGVCDRIIAAQIPTIAGNCEKQLAARQADCGCGFDDGSACDLLSVGWYSYANRVLRDDLRDWMAGLRDVIMFTAHGRRCAVIHGGLTRIERFLWSVSNDDDFAEEIAAVIAAVGQVDSIISGHSGIAFERHAHGVHWINAGVIGMPPNNGAQTTQYAIMSADGVEFQTLTYDADGASQMMEREGLTQGYHRALISGHWPSEDVLPPALRRL